MIARCTRTPPSSMSKPSSTIVAPSDHAVSPPSGIIGSASSAATTSLTSKSTNGPCSAVDAARSGRDIGRPHVE